MRDSNPNGRGGRRRLSLGTVLLLIALSGVGTVMAAPLAGHATVKWATEHFAEHVSKSSTLEFIFQGIWWALMTIGVFGASWGLCLVLITVLLAVMAKLLRPKRRW